VSNFEQTATAKKRRRVVTAYAAVALTACRATGNAMRIITQPPPSSRCEPCGGELRFKLIEAADRGVDLEYEIFVYANCGREQSFTVSHNHKIPGPRGSSGVFTGAKRCG